MGSLPYGKTLVPRPVALLAGLLVVLAAAAGGWLAADQLTRDPVTTAPTPALDVVTGTAALKLGGGWQLEPKVPRVPGLDAADAKALAPADGGRGRMVIALLPDETGDLPKATIEALRVPLGASERATVGGIRGVGYTALSLKGVNGLADLYTIRTPGGLLAISCIAPIDDPLPVDSCPGDVTSLTVTVPAAPDPAAKLKTALPALAAALNKERTAGRDALSTSAHSDAQAAAARGLWRAYREAASSASAVAPKSGAGAQVPGAFLAAASAYRALGAAATKHDKTAWTRARRDVDAAEATAAQRLAALDS